MMIEHMTADLEQTSETDKLFAALAKAQGAIQVAAKDKRNLHFGSKYADLASVWDACREHLSANELCVIQQPLADNGKIGVRTVVGHSSGQWFASRVWTTPRDAGPQALGSCVTYLRRYSLSAAVGVAPDDDDGENAEGRGGKAWPAKKQDASEDKIAAGRAHAAKMRQGQAAQSVAELENDSVSSAVAAEIASEPSAQNGPHVDMGEAASEEAKASIRSLLKGLAWKTSYTRIWFTERFGDAVGQAGNPLEALTQVQAETAHALLAAAAAYGVKDPRYAAVLAECVALGTVLS